MDEPAPGRSKRGIESKERPVRGLPPARSAARSAPENVEGVDLLPATRATRGRMPGPNCFDLAFSCLVQWQLVSNSSLSKYNTLPPGATPQNFALLREFS